MKEIILESSPNAPQPVGEEKKKVENVELIKISH